MTTDEHLNRIESVLTDCPEALESLTALRAHCERLGSKMRGTPQGMLDAMYELAERECGYLPVQAEPALVTIAKWIANAKSALAELERKQGSPSTDAELESLAHDVLYKVTDLRWPELPKVVILAALKSVRDSGNPTVAKYATVQPGNPAIPSPSDESTANRESTSLEDRVAEWICTRIGPEHMHSRERAMRLLEEAVELVQAEGILYGQACAQVGHVYDRPIGNPAQEAAGVAVCLLGWCAATGNRMTELALAEIQRIEAKPIEQIRGSLARKADADLVTALPNPESHQEDAPASNGVPKGTP